VQVGEGKKVIKAEIYKDVVLRKDKEPQRYLRLVDALLLEDCIKIVTNPQHYANHFKEVLKYAFPNCGNAVPRLFLERLIEPRNRLAHVHPITIRQAEQVICYCNDVIDSIKQYYKEKGISQMYNVPSFVRFRDSLGHTVDSEFFGQLNNGARQLFYLTEEDTYLRPGDRLTIELDVDPSFPPDSFIFKWVIGTRGGSEHRSNRIEIILEETDVQEAMWIQCILVSNKKWHRFGGVYDDVITISYKVLPPL
jgi:hypothetical protein